LQRVLVYNLRLTHLVSCSLVVMAKKKLLAANVDTIIHSHPETKDQCMCWFGSTDCTNHKKTLQRSRKLVVPLMQKIVAKLWQTLSFFRKS